MRGKIIKKAAVLALAMVISISGMGVASLSGESISVVEAASLKAKLSKKTLTVKAGQTKRLKMKNYKKRVKWYSSDKSVVTVSKSGKVKGIRPGSAYVIAKAGKKKYKCAVTVDFSEKLAKKKLSVRYEEGKSCTVAYLTNNNSYAISISATKASYNSSGIIMDTAYDNDYCVGPKETVVLDFTNPKVDGEYVMPPSYKITYDVEQSHYRSYATDISTAYNIDNSGIMTEVKNNSGKTLGTIEMKCLMYDDAGNLLDVGYNFADCYDPGSSDYITFSLPLDGAYRSIVPASVKIVVDHAYSYN